MVDIYHFLALRQKQKDKKPKFRQTDSHKKKKLADKWKRPDGIHNKTRYHLHGKCPMVQVGYGSPAIVRGLHPSGFKEKLVQTPADLNGLDPKIYAVRIAKSVGQRKCKIIEQKAAEAGIKVLNPRGESNESV